MEKARILMLEKMDLFNQYHTATIKLKQGIEKGDAEQMVAFLKKRHHIINQVEGIHRSVPAESMIMDQDNANALKDLLNRIADIEKECMELAIIERNTTKRAVLDRRTMRKGQIQYGGSGLASARYIDTRVT